MKTRHTVIALAPGVLLAALALASGPAAAQAGKPALAPAKLVITGSSTMAPLITVLARRFQAANPGVAITVEAGGSGRGVADARSGKADIGMASRELKPDEKKDLFAITIARDGLAFVVHRDNPVRSITRAQVIAICQGKLTNWSALGGRDAAIHVVTRTPGHSSLEIVSEYCGVKPEAIKAQSVAGDNPDAVKAVQDDPNAFTFFSFAFALDSMQAGKPIAPLAVDGVPATADELRSGRYPLGRPLHLLTRSVPAGADGFIEKPFHYEKFLSILHGVLPAH